MAQSNVINFIRRAKSVENFFNGRQVKRCSVLSVPKKDIRTDFIRQKVSQSMAYLSDVERVEIVCNLVDLSPSSFSRSSISATLAWTNCKQISSVSDEENLIRTGTLDAALTLPKLFTSISDLIIGIKYDIYLGKGRWKFLIPRVLA